METPAYWCMYKCIRNNYIWRMTYITSCHLPYMSSGRKRFWRFISAVAIERSPPGWRGIEDEKLEDREKVYIVPFGIVFIVYYNCAISCLCKMFLLFSDIKEERSATKKRRLSDLLVSKSLVSMNRVSIFWNHRCP